MTRLMDELRPRDQRSAARVLVVALVLALVATVAWRLVAWVDGRPGARLEEAASSAATRPAHSGIHSDEPSQRYRLWLQSRLISACR